MSENKVSRRDFLNIAWGTVGALAVTELSLVGLRFFSPRTAEGEFGGTFNLGSPDQYPPGSVTPVESGRFYLVRLEDSGFLAIYRRCTHLGCAVIWKPDKQEFVCPCHEGRFDKDGKVTHGVPPLPLEELSVVPVEGDPNAVIVGGE